MHYIRLQNKHQVQYINKYICLQSTKYMLGTAITANRFTACCNQGKVKLPYLTEPPEYLQYLLSSPDSEAKTFRKNIQQYNSSLVFTSVKYNVDDRTYRILGGIQCFQIHGELFHLQGPLQGENHTSAQFAQLYFYDLELVTTLRVARNPDILQQSILQRLTNELLTVNPFITIFKTAKERLESADNQGIPLRIILNPQLRLIVETGADKRQENLPTSNEVAIIIPNEYDVAGNRDIILADRNSLLQLTLIMQHIWLYIMFCCFHMGNMGGIGRYSWKMLQDINVQDFHNVLFIGFGYISVLESQRLYFLHSVYFNNKSLMHGLFAIKTNSYG